MGKRSGPHRGSLQFYPRKKTKRIYPSVSTFPKTETPKLLGFPAYKAGMTHVIANETHDKSPAFGQQIAMPVTILETPDVFIYAIRLYERSPFGLKITAEVIAEKIPKELSRKIFLPKTVKTKEQLEKAEKQVEKAAVVRVIIATQPVKISLKKTPELLEVGVGGKDVRSAWEYAKKILGTEVKAKDVFSEGAWIDVVGVTKGKGLQGPVKRFGIKIQPRKAHGHRRRPGAIGPWNPPRVLHTVPMQGQMGFFKRTEYNKRIIKIGDDGKKITPSGGIVNYGEISSSYILVKGSVPGAKKRMIVIREPIRGHKELPMPTLLSVSLKSQQG
ncbi:MAG: 50S ribosomal protein L3 [archaeon]